MKALKSLGGVVAGVVILFAIYGVVLLVRGALEARRRAKLTAEAPAVVAAVNVTSRTNRSNRSVVSQQTDITYRYAVGGRIIEAKTTKDGRLVGTKRELWAKGQAEGFEPGMRAKACYNPSQPEESQIFMPGHKCGS